VSRLPGLPYVVVDSNQLRFPEVIEPLIQEYDRAGQRIVLPAVSAYELTKGGGNNFAASVRLLQRRPDAISVAHHTLTLVRQHEQKFVRPVVDVTDADNTNRLRTIMRQLRDGVLTENEVRTGLAEMATGTAAQIDGLGYESLIRSGVATASVLSKSQRNLFRSAFRAEDRAALVKLTVPELTHERLHGLVVAVVKVPYAKARKLVRVPSFCGLAHPCPHPAVPALGGSGGH
jgi:hypothetical protein